MTDRITIPDIAPLVEPLLGRPYDELRCRPLVAHLYQQGFGLDLDAPGGDVNQLFQEVWYQGDPGDPLTVMQSWDLVIIAPTEALPISTHVGVAVDAQSFVHARKSANGVAVARLRTWKSHLLQLARLRELL